jgi:hypothetical protein
LLLWKARSVVRIKHPQRFTADLLRDAGTAQQLGVRDPERFPFVDVVR